MSRHVMTATLLISALLLGWSRAAQVSDSWEWLGNTYWYVPTENLPAVQFNAFTQRIRQITDQTVFHIERYSSGYFWGKTAVQLIRNPLEGVNPPPPLCFEMVGSVTPEGNLSISFTSTSRTSGIATIGIGNMRMPASDWTMQLQMSSGFGRQVTHWAYMVQCKSGADCPLPGVQSTLQELLDQCIEPPPHR